MTECAADGCEAAPAVRCMKCGSFWCESCTKEDNIDGLITHQCPKRGCGAMCKTLSGGYRRAPKIDHGDEVTKISRYIRAIGGKPYVRHQYKKVYGDKGVPDMCAFIPLPRSDAELFFEIEVKVGEDEQKDEQEEYEVHCRSAGVPYVLGGIDDVEAFVQRAWGQ